ncbi:MAG: fluoride efflux transporter CrcB [Bacteroidetes bacterium]|nr:fluoride efflux transporter CrcB [Bacteroidota bacterium]
MKAIFIVFIGGGLGSVFRYAIGTWVGNEVYTWPWASWLVNLIGSFIIGILFGWSSMGEKNQALWLFGATGFCGGFTTFSALSKECLVMIQNQQWMLALLYIAGSVIGGLLCVGLGYWLIRNI